MRRVLLAASMVFLLLGVSGTAYAGLLGVPVAHDQNTHVSQTGSVLHLADSAFSPATPVAKFTRLESNTLADKDWFGVNHHAVSYESLHRVTGYYERADWQPGGSTDTVVFRYQGSIFTSTQTALTAWQDGVATTSTAANPSRDCSSTLHTACAIIRSTAKDGTPTLYLVLRHNACLIESAAATTSTLFSSQSSQIDATLASIAVRGLAAAKLACPSSTVRFKIISVRLQAQHAWDWNLVHPPLMQAKAGSTATLTVYWALENAPPGPRVRLRFTILHNGHIVFRRVLPGTIAYAASRQPYGYRYQYTLPRLPGVYVFRARVVVNGLVQQASSAFAILRRAPLLRAIAFNFTRMHIVNVSNHAQASFHPGQMVGVVLGWTTHNIRSSTHVDIITALQFPSGSGWRPIGAPLFTAFDVANGPHDYEFRFIPPEGNPRIRVLVGITIGSRTQQRSVVIRVG
ncbi:MAG: hypothetical protein ACR2JC_16765 [Chloroflexota bacterium]